MNIKKKLILPGLVGLSAFTATAGGSLITSSTANADTASASAKTSQSTKQQQDWSKGGHQAGGKTEEVLTGDNLSKATTAAEAAQSGATVKRAETDVDGDGTYEVHMQKSDGSLVTVFLDSNFKVTSSQDGMGKGPRGDQPKQATTSTTTNN